MSIVDNVLALQAIDLKIRELQKKIKDIPAQKSKEEARLASHKAAVELADKNLKAKMAEVKKQELEVEARNQKISKLRTQQMELKTNKEFKAVEDEVSAIKREIAQLEEQELLVMEDVEKMKESVKIAQAELQKESDSVKKDQQGYDVLLADAQKQLEAAAAVREEAAKAVDPAWLANYNRIFKAKDKALVPLEPMEDNRSGCGGCHMTLSPATVNEARRHVNMVACDWCGRLLY